MKDFDKQDADGSLEAAHLSPAQVSRAPAPQVEADRGEEPASPSVQKMEALSAKDMAHPANAAPLADMLNELQRSYGNTYVQHVVADISQTNSTPGQALDAGVKSSMESAFGENFGDVRVHTDLNAERMNEELGARAVTRGRDIYFGRGEYDPATRDGKELLAHELTHVVQQRGSAGGSRGDSMNRAGDAFEAEANDVAASVMRGEHIHVQRQSGAPSHQRQGAGVRTPPQPAAPPSFSPETHIVSPAHPSGTLTNGWPFRYIQHRPGASDCILDIVVPAGVTAVARSSRFSTEMHSARESSGGTLRETAVVVSVLAAQGQSGLVAVTFRFGVGGGQTTVGTVIFDLRGQP